jgi:hypothetical protein
MIEKGTRKMSKKILTYRKPVKVKAISTKHRKPVAAIRKQQRQNKQQRQKMGG